MAYQGIILSSMERAAPGWRALRSQNSKRPGNLVAYRSKGTILGGPTRTAVLALSSQWRRILEKRMASALDSPKVAPFSPTHLSILFASLSSRLPSAWLEI